MVIDKETFLRKLVFIWFWIFSCTGFVFDECLPENFAPIGQYILILCDLMTVVLMALTIRHKIDVLIIISFLVISYVSSCMLNGLPLMVWGNGMRVFYGLLFVMPVVRYFWDDTERHDRFVEAWDRQLYAFLIVQAICIIYQYMKYGAGDPVGGSFGAAGYSGTVSMSIYLVSFYLIRKHLDYDNLWTSVLKNWKYWVLLFPTFMNETKISFVLLLLYFLLLMPIDRKLIRRLMLGLPMVALVLTVSLYIFSSLTMYNGDFTAEEVFSDAWMSEYFFIDIDESKQTANWGLEYDNTMPDVPRLTKIAIIPFIMDEEPGHEWFGFGLGHFMNGSIMGTTAFYDDYEWLLIGTNPMIFFVMMQLGLLGLIWYAVMHASWFFRTPRKFPKKDYNIQLFVLFLVIAMLVYGSFFRNVAFCFLVLSIFAMSWKAPNGKDPENVVTTVQTPEQ
ncbi:MAG: hypothetical protein J6N71_10590 [Muribaculaceae bacterium]|nr:hypothetical protein [Muribaculaceae bacterium]